jgi:hypothetical protein
MTRRRAGRWRSVLWVRNLAMGEDESTLRIISGDCGYDFDRNSIESRHRRWIYCGFGSPG